MTLPKEIHSRINEYQSRYQDRQVKPYVIWDGGTISQVNCKVCGCPIAGLKESEHELEAKKINQVVVKKVAMVFGYFNNYRELKLKFDDGSFHITNVCSQCLPNLTPDDLEYIYLCDLAQFEADSKRGMGSEVKWATLIDRLPYKIMEKSDGGIV